MKAYHEWFFDRLFHDSADCSSCSDLNDGFVILIHLFPASERVL